MHVIDIMEITNKGLFQLTLSPSSSVPCLSRLSSMNPFVASREVMLSVVVVSMVKQNIMTHFQFKS